MNLTASSSTRAVAYSGEGHWAMLHLVIFFHQWKKMENVVCPLRVITSGQRKFAPPPYEILNTPLHHAGTLI